MAQTSLRMTNQLPMYDTSRRSRAKIFLIDRLLTARSAHLPSSRLKQRLFSSRPLLAARSAHPTASHHHFRVTTRCLGKPETRKGFRPQEISRSPSDVSRETSAFDRPRFSLAS